MILSKNAILKEIKNGSLKIEPDFIVKEASIKTHLSGLFGETTNAMEPLDKFVLKPKNFILAKAKEIITLPPSIAAFYDGWVGVATKGLFTHGSSMFMNPGEVNHITLELFNASDNEIVLEKDMRVGQYIFMRVEGV